jgi:Uma2 family endonuclease
MARASATPPSPWTVDEFLEWERQQEERYEYLQGLIRMMVGGTADHNTIALNIAAALRAGLQGEPCRVFMEGMKVRTAAAAMYPDMVVTCADVPPKDDVVGEPALVVEVLSRSTETFDRGPKWAAYQSIASLRQYALVSQDELRIDLYSRRGEGWTYQVLTGRKAKLRIAIGDFDMSTVEIYEGSSLDPRRRAAAG